jgi:hypothetical protein
MSYKVKITQPVAKGAKNLMSSSTVSGTKLGSAILNPAASIERKPNKKLVLP